MAKETSFADRLALYGLSEKDAHAETLRVGKKQTVYLGSLGKTPSLYTPRFLGATGIDDVKKWVGIPDSVMKKKRKLAESRKLAKPPSEKIIAAFDKLYQPFLKEEDPGKKKTLSREIYALVRKNGKDLYPVARAYIYGNSNMYKNWQTILDWHYRDFQLPVWLFPTVIIEAGAVLEINEGHHKLIGNTLVIEHGGTLRARSFLNLDFMQMKRTL